MVQISFIIPVYNAEATITNCISSILDQTFDLKIEREIIVVDNNSTDHTTELLKQFKDQISVINEKIRSRSKARQAGLNMAKGEFVAFVDADVILDPHWTQLNLEQMLSRPQLGAVQGSLIPVLEKPWHRMLWHHTRFRTFGTFNLLSLIGTNIIPVVDTAASLWRKCAIKEGFNLNLNRAEDVDLTMRVLYAGYSLGGAKSVAKVRWDKSLTAWFKRFYDQASAEKYVYHFWGISPRPVIVENIMMHPFWGSLPTPVQMAECFLTSLHAIGFKKDHPTTVDINRPELQKQDNAFVTFKSNAFYLSENIRSVFFNDYVALLNLNTMKCYWVYADESKWPETMKQQLIQAKVVIPRQN